MENILFYFFIPLTLALAYFFVTKLLEITVLNKNSNIAIVFTRINTVLSLILNVLNLFLLFVLFGKCESVISKIKPDFLRYFSLMRFYSFEEILGLILGLLCFSLITFFVSALFVKNCVQKRDHQKYKTVFGNYRICRILEIICAVYFVLVMILWII